MENQDIQLLVKQMRNIMLNKPFDKNVVCKSEELQELQGAILFLANSMEEFHHFLKRLSAGVLDMKELSNQNFLAGYLKELQSILKHLTWQASQVAQGDYQQRVTFLGEFSISFNKMIAQLEEREINLKEKSKALSQSMNLLVNVLDKQKDWILVIDKSSKKIVYTNEQAKLSFYNTETKKTACGEECDVLKELLDHNYEEVYEKEYFCPINGNYLSIHGHPISWADKEAIVYSISNITSERKKQKVLKNMAYTDTLTSLYNRRYALDKLQTYLNQHQRFCMVNIDVDNLKYVNDVYGHPTGDEYLRYTASLLKNVTNRQGFACRMGGDEFLIVMLDESQERLEAKMKKVLLSLHMHTNQYHASFSYGVLEVDENNKDSLESLLDQVDSIMYKMKKHNKQSIK